MQAGARLRGHSAAAARRGLNGHQVTDLGGYLLGGWAVAKLGWEGRRLAMRFHGTAAFSPHLDGLVCEERGRSAFGAYEGAAGRLTRYHLTSPGTAEVCFADGEPFHELCLAAGHSLVQHRCGADEYEGRYRVLGPNRWIVTWRVTGPRKRQIIASRFSRLCHL